MLRFGPEGGILRLHNEFAGTRNDKKAGRAMTDALKVQELINLLLAMNPKADVLLRGDDGRLSPLVADDVQEIYAPEKPAKTVAHIGGPKYQS